MVLDRDMLQKPFSEVEIMLKNKRNNLSLNKFATISGIKGKQFGKEVFSSVVKFKDLVSFLDVFPDVQRNVNPRKVGKIKNYVLSGVEDPHEMRFFPGITVTARGNVYYDELSMRIAIDTENSKLSVNDGQHRFYGIDKAIQELEFRKGKAKDRESMEKWGKLLDDLKEMVIPIVIFNNLTEEEEKQLFHDSNNLAQRPSRSATIRLAQTDYYSRLARELSESNEYLLKYGVEYNKMSIHENNPNTVLLTTVYTMIRQLYWTESKKDYYFINENNYSMYFNQTEYTFNNIFSGLPQDLQQKGKYIIDKNYTLKGIAKFIHNARKEGKEDANIFDAISKVDWTVNLDYWSKYGAFRSQRGLLSFGGSDGIFAVMNACTDNLT